MNPNCRLCANFHVGDCPGVNGNGRPTCFDPPAVAGGSCDAVTGEILDGAGPVAG